MNEIQHYLPQVRASLCGNFPSPHDGETLFSVCSRFHQLTAWRKQTLTGILLFDAPRASRKRCVPTGLHILTRYLPEVFGSVQSTLQFHTVGSLYLRFMSMEQSRRASNACSELPHERTRFTFDWASSRFEQQHPLRLCPICAVEQEQQSGYAYWKVAHQLPGAWMCLDHNEPLRLGASSKDQSSWTLPVANRSTHTGNTNERDRRYLHSLSDTVVQLCGPDSANLGELRIHICRALEQAQVVHASRALDMEKVQKWMRSYIFSVEKTYLQAFEPVDASESAWAVLGKKKALHPLRWALILACLRLEGAPLQPMLDAMRGPVQPDLAGLKLSELPTAPDRAFKWMESGMEILEIAQLAGVSRTIVQRWLCDPLLHQVWATAKYQILRNKHETSIRSAMATGAKTRLQLRLAANAAYQWFRKNDRTWLDSLLPSQAPDKQLPLWP